MSIAAQAEQTTGLLILPLHPEFNNAVIRQWGPLGAILRSKTNWGVSVLEVILDSMFRWMEDMESFISDCISELSADAETNAEDNDLTDHNIHKKIDFLNSDVFINFLCLFHDCHFDTWKSHMVGVKILDYKIIDLRMDCLFVKILDCHHE